MNKIQWIGIIGIACVILFMLAGCSWDIEWQRYGNFDPITVATCDGPTTDWPCLEEADCFS